MALVRPRLTDHYDIAVSQETVAFAIPFLDEDIPLYVDPFLLWKSPSLQDQALHTVIVDTFNHIGQQWINGKEQQALNTLVGCSECSEVGLGSAKNRKGHRVSEKTAAQMLDLFKTIPEVRRDGFAHIEEVQLLVDGIAKDRISDISCSLLKSFLIDFTVEQCELYGLPLEKVKVPFVYDYRKRRFADEEVRLPVTPGTSDPILLVPKRWLRYAPWISFDNYFKGYYVPEIQGDTEALDRVRLLTYNRQNYGMVQTYIQARERTQDDCRNDPLFSPIPVLSSNRKLSTILKLPTGKGQNADRQYEDNVCQLMASILYPHLDFAAEQSRTDSGVLIRDLVFYNNRSLGFLQDIYKEYGSRQIVFELKNVATVERDHINQLNRYLSDHFGRFGIIVTRHRLPRAMFRSTVDLWAGQRKCIIALDDEDLSLMVNVYESKQRLPIEIINKKFAEFMRACPS